MKKREFKMLVDALTLLNAKGYYAQARSLQEILDRERYLARSRAREAAGKRTANRIIPTGLEDR